MRSRFCMSELLFCIEKFAIYELILTVNGNVLLLWIDVNIVSYESCP